MGQLFLLYLMGPKVYTCSTCSAHLSTHDHIISKQFHGAHGRAYLFQKVVNICYGEPIDRQMTTGLHTVVDIHCKQCETVLGWKYEKAYAQDQKYKEGKFILEKSLIHQVDQGVSL